MKNLVLLMVTLMAAVAGYAQSIPSYGEKIDRASHILQPALQRFKTDVITHDLDSCIQQLLPLADDPAKKFVVGNFLFNIDVDHSYRLHEAAWQADSSQYNYLLEYAMELQRRGSYSQATPLLEKFAAYAPDDYRLQVWLADCYINTGQPEKAITAWKKADYNNHHNHNTIDQAIWTVYGQASQLRQRNSWRKEVSAGKSASAYPLIFLDSNWETDWWNTIAMDSFLMADLQLAQEKGLAARDLQVLQFYADLKQLPEITYSKLMDMLAINQLILNNHPLPASGKLAGSLLDATFNLTIADPDEFFALRGDELLRLAKKHKDVAYLNIYSKLQTAIKGKVAPEIALTGWKEYHDEGFAVSYLNGKVPKTTYDDPELDQALKAFPDAPLLYFMKASLANIEKKPDQQELLIKTIQREFRSLGSDPHRYATKLNQYFDYLSQIQ
ncbi:M48 family metallopeptidase [Chitinophaga sp. HK235]|uniref:tetratricopeptide repeat protein n=1 Tax=Chitinophaga sp. HK235 TaxID=2952571 RepID=UPI001BA71C71|nr:tetratricopeptide repeat protein [Chitinophaga sp. HK235]